MEVQIRPAAMGRQSTPIAGRVRSAARYPATQSQMLRTLASKDLVDALTGAGPRLEVIIEVLPGAEKSHEGLFSGTPCRVEVTLHKHSPIHLVLPGPEDSNEL